MGVRGGQDADFMWLVGNDPNVDPEWIKRCLHHGEYILETEGSENRGFLRFSMFWGNIPYMDLIWVVEGHRRQGVGSGMFRFWKQEMAHRGARILMTSAMENEPEPQAWHRRNGFKASGQLTFGKLEQTPEVFFVLDLV